MSLSRIAAFALVLGLAACGSGERSRAVDRTTRSSTTTSTAPTTTATELPTTTTVPAPQYRFGSGPIEGSVRARVEGSSWRAGCPVPLEQLRHVTVSYWGFDGAAHDGELVVNADAVDAIREAFRRLFEQRFPIHSMRLVDDFGADDFTSIEADNTSAFNCRERSTGGGVWSQHAYGRAIDVNPIENPYVSGGTTTHSASRPYLDRSNVRAGMAVAGGDLVSAFAAVGWGWGGTWSSPTDFQHFSSSGR